MADIYRAVRPGLSLTETEAARILMLRLRKPTSGAIEQAGRLLGCILPIEPNHAAGSDVRAVWMGPNEWMVIEPQAAPADLDALPGAAAMLAVEVGDGRYALDVEGTEARDFLSKAVSIDMHSRQFPVGRSAMTLFAQIPVVIDHVAADRFRLWFDISLRDYVRKWCEEALIEFAA